MKQRVVLKVGGETLNYSVYRRGKEIRCGYGKETVFIKKTTDGRQFTLSCRVGLFRREKFITQINKGDISTLELHKNSEDRSPIQWEEHFDSHQNKVVLQTKILADEVRCFHWEEQQARSILEELSQATETTIKRI